VYVKIAHFGLFLSEPATPVAEVHLQYLEALSMVEVVVAVVV
jgi:hypothetical protein